jgi:hypothetical protein
LIENFPWIQPWLVGLLLVYAAAQICGLWPVLKYGPRYWRVTGKMRDRDWRRKNR